MNESILYRYSPETESTEAQLVVLIQERQRFHRKYCEYDDPSIGGRYGVEGA